ncbi:MAG TPA: methyltransferase domain-containing protein [Pilimelia sp.]|nr:methyltransferase domain-containing protein [Pilimelia sp.]
MVDATAAAPDPDEVSRRMAAESLADGDPTGWFERLYRAAAAGTTRVPWDRGGPNPFLPPWARRAGVAGRGRRALVVGCGLGDDAEYVAGLGFATVAFDVSAAALAACRQRFPGSAVAYELADLLDPPRRWIGAFDLVVESQTVQALPRSLRAVATANGAATVAPGGTLLVLAGALPADGDPDDGPPWRLTRPEVEAFATGGLAPVRIELLADPARPGVRRWRAEFRRP